MAWICVCRVIPIECKTESGLRTMKYLNQSLVLIMCCLLMVLSSGCGDKDAEEAQLKIESLEKEVATLTALLNDANKKMEALGVNDRLTRGNCDEIKAWADSVVKGHGQGVWYMGEDVYPEFIKQVKSGTVETLIEELNKKFRSDKLPEVLYLGTEKDKVQVGVSDDQQLTSGMGSAGAASYMNAVTFTLGSVPGISCVEFKFEEGDHASPGTLCRSFIKQ